jgi:F-type H+-transporting ATPase subunit epsilon
MGIGVLRVETPAAEHKFFVDGGFAQMVDNRLTLLTEQAKRAEDIDRAAAERALSEARALPMVSDAEFAAHQKAVQRAEVQVKLADEREK